MKNTQIPSSVYREYFVFSWRHFFLILKIYENNLPTQERSDFFRIWPFALVVAMGVEEPVDIFDPYISDEVRGRRFRLWHTPDDDYFHINKKKTID